MDQDKQPLLEAAKAFSADVGLKDWSRTTATNLRAAIARTESEILDFHKTNLPHIDRARKAEDRAQQAEADAAWHKAESARLSAELAKEREENRTNNGYLARVREEVGVHPLDTVHSLRQRAEKAEAELAKLIDMKVNPVVFAPEPSKVEMQTHAFGSNAVGGKPQRDDDNEDPVDPMTGWTFATYRRVVEALGGGPRVVG